MRVAAAGRLMQENYLFPNDAPDILDEWRNRGLQGRVIGGDNQTLVVSRL